MIIFISEGLGLNSETSVTTNNVGRVCIVCRCLLNYVTLHQLQKCQLGHMLRFVLGASVGKIPVLALTVNRHVPR